MKKIIFLFCLPMFAWAQTLNEADLKSTNTATVSCNLTLTTTIEGFNVFRHNPSTAFMYKAKFTVDADGSPNAYGPNNSGLDWTANAGSPGNWWGIVTNSAGNPVIQNSSDPSPGMYVSTTSLVKSTYPIINPLRYINSETRPYFVIPLALKNLAGMSLGDVGYVYNTITGLGEFAIYADSGPANKLGEGSIYLANHIGLNDSPKYGGTSQGIISYIMFPSSGFGQGKIPTVAQIDSMGNSQIAAIGGTAAVGCLSTIVDITAPTTQIATPNVWDTTNFVVTFTDADNSMGSGVEKSFYQVSDLNTSNQWRANNSKGFFNDDFDGTAIHPDWTQKSGVWSITSNSLIQNDQANTNTNLYAALTQTLSNRYLYNWTGSIGGTGTNRRAGFHFFCDAPDSSNRGNSYFVYFRLDGSSIQIYKSVNNSYGAGPVKDTAHAFLANQDYDFKVSYDRLSGYIKVYVNNVLSARWKDNSPLASGTHVSFRNGNCTYKVDNFKVFRSRNPTATISVGAASTNYIRFQNQNPASPAAKIRSIITDAAGNLSTIITKTINIDWTNPSVVSNLNDGSVLDIDTTTNGTQLQANWQLATDPHSGIKNYYYAIGTGAGATDVVTWTNLPSFSTSITATGLNLILGQTYFVSLRSENMANMLSSVISTNGQIYFNGLVSIKENNVPKLNIQVYPNPNNGQFEVQHINGKNTKTTIKIVDILGKLVYQTEFENNRTAINLTDHESGIYYVTLIYEDNLITRKIVVSE